MKLMVAALILASLCSCQRSSSAETSAAQTATPAPSPVGVDQKLTLSALQNAVYCTSLDEADAPIKLTQGSYSYLSDDQGTEESVSLEQPMAFGDLNGDGHEDAVVLLASIKGGTGHFWSVAAVVNDHGVPVHYASAPLGDRVVVKSIRIEGGGIYVDMVTHGANDPLCCPTVPKTKWFTLYGTSLHDQTEGGA
jgi:hypothetical protein